MSKYLAVLFSLLASTISAVECTTSVELGLGWRRDSLEWDVSRLQESHVEAEAFSDICFKDIDMYTAHAKAKWVGSEFYFRLAADYGLSVKGRAVQHFGIASPFVAPVPLTIHVSDRIKRRSEFYDFSGAVGYPFTFSHCCLVMTPVIGYSYHRQRIRSKTHREDSSFSSDFSLSSSNPFFPGESSPSFDSSSGPSGGPFWHSGSSSSSIVFDPFSYPSEEIASLIGFSAHKRTSMYRLSWYGPFLGIDIAYGLDDIWSLFTELEWHCLSNCHRKRNSNTAVAFVDDYHHKGWAYGFNGSFGTTFAMCDCWYGALEIDFKWWRSCGHNDTVHWKSVGAFATLGYIF